MAVFSSGVDRNVQKKKQEFNISLSQSGRNVSRTKDWRNFRQRTAQRGSRVGPGVLEAMPGWTKWGAGGQIKGLEGAGGAGTWGGMERGGGRMKGRAGRGGKLFDKVFARVWSSREHAEGERGRGGPVWSGRGVWECVRIFSRRVFLLNHVRNKY